MKFHPVLAHGSTEATDLFMIRKMFIAYSSRHISSNLRVCINAERGMRIWVGPTM